MSRPTLTMGLSFVDCQPDTQARLRTDIDREDAADSGNGTGIGLRPAYRVAQMRDADALNDHRVAKDGWRAGEVVEESNAGAKKNRRDVDADLVEEAGIQQLPDGVGAVDPDRLSGGGGFGLTHGGLDAVGHEVDGRAGTWPSGGNLVGQHEGRSPGVIPAPTVGHLEGASAGEHGAQLRRQTTNVLGARRGHLERH